ncbi:dna topoisomerase 2-alpha-like protein [Dermatophagoides farinae]|uniref:DNA topoisomerase (ATP-hydrolyzing) n=1 Tax=Dermatophagoides farinae TaxID=6954 RepID=A0A9D4P0M7_DERFA|nr:dna topoisomerase 2-alpha-like protein [Dermatophagoides farinae]
MNFFQIFLTSDGHQPANMRTNATCSAIDLNNQLDNPNDVQHHQLKQAGSIITQQPDHRHHPEQRINQIKFINCECYIRPNIGSVEKVTKQMWVYDSQDGMVLRDVSYVPQLYKIFDEILVNIADDKICDQKMTIIKIEINM